MPILREMILPNIQTLVSILSECPEAPVRKAASDVIGHCILVALESTGTSITYSQRPVDHNNTDDLSDDVDENVVKTVLSKILVIFKKEKKDLSYKKLKGYFKMWSYIVKTRQDILLWLIKEHQFVETLLSTSSLPKITILRRRPALTNKRMAIVNMSRLLNLS